MDRIYIVVFGLSHKVLLVLVCDYFIIVIFICTVFGKVLYSLGPISQFLLSNVLPFKIVNAVQTSPLPSLFHVFTTPLL